jgi:hypothetical protein
MARKKRISFGERLGHAVSDFANAASVAATGSEIGILERAAEEEIGSPAVERRQKSRVRRKRKPKLAAGKRRSRAAPKKKKIASGRTRRPKKKKRAAARRRSR